MQSNTSYIISLLDILRMKEEVLISQNNMILELLNENLEKENMINVLMSEFANN